MKNRRLLILLFLTLVSGAVLLNWWIHRGTQSTDDAAMEAHITPISAKVEGYLATVEVRDNQSVKKGDLLATVDIRDYQLKLEAARAAVKAAEVALGNAAANAKRQLTVGARVTSQRDIDNAVAAEQTARADLDKARAQLAIAGKDLTDTRITAPEDGVVTLRTAEPGAFVTSGKTILTLVGRERWVVANFKEVQLTKICVGQPVKITVDAYPDLALTGKVESIQSGTGARFSAFPPENATGNFVKIVQRVPVKITLNEKLPMQPQLGAGLSVVPVVDTTVACTP